MTYSQPLQNPSPQRRRHGVRNGCLLGFAIVVAALIAIGAIAAAIGGGSKPSAGHGYSAPAYTAPAVTQTPNPVATTPAGTLSEQNALSSAQDYLSMQAFSRKGLIEQLSSKNGEGFPKADAVWAVNHLHANWFAQAVRSAREYLSMQSFSRSGLIDQLSSSSGEQFTVAQATYAANKIGL